MCRVHRVGDDWTCTVTLIDDRAELVVVEVVDGLPRTDRYVVPRDVGALFIRGADDSVNYAVETSA